MSRSAPLPSGLGDAFRVRDALDAGVSAQRLRTRSTARPHHGVRSASEDRLVALLPLMRRDHAFSGPTAARLHSLPLPGRFDADSRIHVVSFSDNRMRRRGVVCTRGAPRRVMLVGGLPVLDPIETWISLAGVLTSDDLVAVADRIVTGDRGRRPSASLGDLRAAVFAAAGRRHIRDLRRAVVEVRVGAWSRPETLLRLLIVRDGLPEPELNPQVRLASGEIVRPDLAWVDSRVAVEYDGSAFHGSAQWDRDALRHELLVDEGWIIVRVRSHDLFRDPDALLVRLRGRLASRAVKIDPSSGGRKG